MRYMLMQTKDGYREYPLPKSVQRCAENQWQVRDGKQVFCLCGERRFFDRGENLAISSGMEAAFRIHGLKSRFYIRGMKLFFEIRDEENLYLNRRKIGKGDLVLHPGDVLFLEKLKIEVWEKEIAVWGSSDYYETAFTERSKVRRPEGFPVYKRSPRLIKRTNKEKITLELPRQEEEKGRGSFLMSALPSLGMMLLTVVLGLVMGRGIYLLTSAAAAGMTAVFTGIRYVSEQSASKEKSRKRRVSFMNYLWGKQKEIAIAYEREAEVYAYQYPDVNELAGMIRKYDGRIYERVPSDEDFLTLSIGCYTGKTDLQIEGKEPAWDAKEEILTETVRKIRQRYSMIERPRAVDLKRTHLGMVGEKEALHRQLSVLAAQAAFFHSYHDLRMIVIYNRDYEDQFAWMRWLPHTRLGSVNLLGLVHSERSGDQVLGSMNQILKERAECLRDGKKTARFLPHYLFLIDEPFRIMDHGIMEYLRRDGYELGFSLIYTSYTRANLPESIGTVLMLENSKEGTMLLEEKEYTQQKIVFDQAQNVDFEWFARDLSVLVHEKGRAGYIPGSVTFFELYKIRRPEELEIRKRWKSSQSYKSLAVPLGLRSPEETLFLNLHEKAHGPHGLVAGTTGSGKSELIQSYILSLAVNFHPYEVGFLLIDYKGGSMAELFHRLPHHLGTITNLDGSGSMRALISVKAELSRRQRIFREFGVNHINGYMRLFKEGNASEPIPHLFIICDEFAELKKEQPDFMKELVSAARIGRSLGVHLLLATQKPAGVIDEQIWSNSRFKLCLKVQNESDSKEVLKTADAAAITLPGRAYLKVGSNEVYELFQSAYSKAACREPDERKDLEDERVYVVNEMGQGELVNRDLSGGTGEYHMCQTQLEAVARHIREVFAEEGKAEVRKPWLPPLGRMLLSPVVSKPVNIKESEGVDKRSASLSVTVGKADIPGMQEQREMLHHFERDGNLLFAASAGFGKTVFLTTVLISLALTYDADDVNFYILDFGNHGCMPMKELLHTAEYISADDDERYRKFKKLIMEELGVRKRLFAEYAAPSPSAYQELSGKSLKTVVVAVDQFDVVKEMGIEEEEFFTKLTRDGVGLGIYTVAAATRVNSIRQATLNNFKNKIAGYQFDENETFLIVGRIPFRQPEIKGRVMAGGEDVHEAQIYTMASCEDKAKYSKDIKALIQESRGRFPGKEAPHIPVLPQEFRSAMLKEYPCDEKDYIVGLDIEEVTGKGFDKSAGLFAVIGNTGSGKTNILRVLADQAAAKGRTRIFDSRDMELYRYRHIPNVLYVEGSREKEIFLKEMAEEVERRRRFLKKRLGEDKNLSPRKLTDEMPFYTIFIDDPDEFTEFMKEDLDRAANIMKEGLALGIVCIISIHAAKTRGISAIDRMVKQAANGLVLSSQGVMPVFPVSSTRELPKFGDGLLFRNGIYQRVRLPRHEGAEL